MAPGWLQTDEAAQQTAIAVVQLLSANEQSSSKAEAVVSPGVSWQDALLPWQTLDTRQIQQLRRVLTSAVPDLQLTVQEVVPAEHSHILLYYTAAGTHTGVLHSSLDAAKLPIDAGRPHPAAVAPTGRSIGWTGSSVVRLEAAASVMGNTGTDSTWRAAAVWHAWDPLFLFEQVGLAPTRALPAAPPAAPVDPQAAQQAGPGWATAAEGQAGKAAVQQYFAVYNSGDFSRLGDIVDPSYHYWGLIDLGGKQGVAAMQAMMSGWRDALSDFSIQNDWLLAAGGDRVIFKWVLKGLHTKGPLRGVVPDAAANPRPIKAWGITALSLRQHAGDDAGGQQWMIWRKVSHANGADLLRQLGVFDFDVAVEQREA